MNSNKTFVIPSVGNKISKVDVDKNQIRITVEFKPFFPSKSGNVKVIIENEYDCTFSHKGDRSHVLRLGKDASTELGLKEGDSMKFTVLGHYVYKLEKV